MNNTALVIGISGGFGAHVAEALLNHGWRVRALLRDPARLPARLRGRVETVQGDAGDSQSVEAAAHDVAVLVYGVNVPYPRWEAEALTLLEPSARVAERHGLRLVFPANVYVLDPDRGPLFDEDAPPRPVSRLGEIRAAMEARLARAVDHGARVLMVRAGDFIGRDTPSSWFGMIVRRGRWGYSVRYPGPPEPIHSWAYLPDLAETVGRLLDEPDTLEALARFHFAGHRVSAVELVAALGEATGEPVRLTAMPWLPLRLAAPVVALFRALLSLRYLWQRRMDLDDTRLRARLGERVPHTPLVAVMAAMCARTTTPLRTAVQHDTDQPAGV